MTRSRAGAIACAAVPVAFVAVFFLYPVVEILDRGLRPDGHVAWRSRSNSAKAKGLMRTVLPMVVRR